MRKRFYLIVFAVLLLTACGSEPVIEPEPVFLHQQSSSIVWDNLNINQITPCNAYEFNGADLQIFPYYNDTKYITIKKIILSNNNFWDTVTEPYKDSENYQAFDSCSLFTLNNGMTIGIKPIDDENAYVVFSDTLPSSYVRAVLKILCN